MHIHVDIELPALPKRRTRRIALALVLALAVAVPGLALASHQFGDVPNANPFHGDISAIANAGVTSGCGGGNYCPDRNVTRGEMAAFMNRLGALSSNKTPVVNADKVDGLDASDFAPVIAIQNGVGGIAGCAIGTLAVVILNAAGDGLDHRFMFQVPGPIPAYGQIRGDASIRNGSANVASVTHTADTGIYCIVFTESISQAALESSVVSLHTSLS